MEILDIKEPKMREHKSNPKNKYIEIIKNQQEIIKGLNWVIEDMKKINKEKDILFEDLLNKKTIITNEHTKEEMKLQLELQALEWKKSILESVKRIFR